MYTQKAIEKVLKEVSKRKISWSMAYQKLKHLPYQSLSFAKIDHHRLIRKNLPEVIYSPGKSIDQLHKIVKTLNHNGNQIILTRLEPLQFNRLKKSHTQLNYSKAGKIAYLNGRVKNKNKSSVAIVTAGTSDIPVAEEARVTLELLGIKTNSFYDLGVAGLHRLLDHLPKIEKSRVIICIAGMEGALASVLAGLTSRPIIAVPTSVGYGAGMKGISALLTMINACAQGVAVVNIDSGFNAACFAYQILMLI